MVVFHGWASVLDKFRQSEPCPVGGRLGQQNEQLAIEIGEPCKSCQGLGFYTAMGVKGGETCSPEMVSVEIEMDLVDT